MSLCQASAEESSTPPDEPNITSLLDLLGRVSDPRSRRGRRHELVFTLACAVIAVLAGAATFRQLASQVADLPQSLLAKLGGKWNWFRRRYDWPSEPTLRRVCQRLDTAQLDLLVGSWLGERAWREGDGRWVIAIDGKVLRGAWTDENGQVTLVSAMIHGIGVTVAQLRVPEATTEVTQIDTLLEAIPAAPSTQVVLTADAAHTHPGTAEAITGRGFCYLLAVKQNQPLLHQTILDRFRPVVITPPAHRVEERSHGRITRWSTWTLQATGVDFPHAAQLGCIRRDEFRLDEVAVSKEFAFFITSSPAEKTSPADLYTQVRGHWGIENKSHYVRDVVYREDHHQAWVGNGPHTLAILRNLTLGLLRLNGIHKITQATEAICRDRLRALPLLAT